MLKFKSITVGPFQENTYIIHNKTKCWIIDPGCYFGFEFDEVKSYIAVNNIVPEKLILTHGHLDHIFANHLVFNEYGLSPIMHKADLFFLENLVESALRYGLSAHPSPLPEAFLDEGDHLFFEDRKVEVIFTPGHSPGSICLYFKEDKVLIGGDTLFRNSIGRTDLPMGHHETLLSSIRNKIFALPDDVIVLSGHGEQTSIGYEKKNNPFLK